MKAAQVVAELLPCPFCGKSPIVQNGDGNKTHPYNAIHCDNDECIGPTTTAAFFDDALFQWNTRPSPDSKLEAYRKALEEILAAEKDFREGMPPGWEGDPLTDACEVARKILAAGGSGNGRTESG